MHRGLSTYEHCIVPPGSTNTERHYRSSVGAGEGASPAGMGMLRSTQSLEAEVDELRAAPAPGAPPPPPPPPLGRPRGCQTRSSRQRRRGRGARRVCHWRHLLRRVRHRRPPPPAWVHRPPRAGDARYQPSRPSSPTLTYPTTSLARSEALAPLGPAWDKGIRPVDRGSKYQRNVPVGAPVLDSRETELHPTLVPPAVPRARLPVLPCPTPRAQAG
jgi:hypothetical protein